MARAGLRPALFVLRSDPAGDTARRYFRNIDTTWRTLPLDTFATVTVLRWRAGGTVAISLAELQRLMRADSRRADRITHDPFRITVVDGETTSVVTLGEDNEPIAPEVDPVVLAALPGNVEVHWPEGMVLLDPEDVDPQSGEPDYGAAVRVEPLPA